MSNLLQFSGEEKPLREVTKGDRDDFRRFLIEQGLAAATVARRCSLAKTFFRAAVRHEPIPRHPFEDVKGTVRGNQDRMRFITREVTQRIIDACPDAEWRLLTPSESLSLRWADVDWEHDRVTVRSPKTEHLPGGESRVIPLFPELRPYLEEIWEQAEPGVEYVITRYREAAQRTPAGGRNCNLRTQFHRIIRRAGIDPWPKPWQNLRSSRETELAEESPIQVACHWIGKSRPVAMEHYLQVTPEHFRRALLSGEATQNPTHAAHVKAPKGSPGKAKGPVIPEEYEPVRTYTNVCVGGARFELATSTV
jgi:integrase